jgi:predicted nucleic acid-binding protein
MIVLDTNVLSALTRPEPDEAVVAWFDRQERRSIWITAITVFETRTGIALLPEGRRRRALDAALVRTVEDALNRRILPFDAAAAEIAGGVAARRRRSGFTDDVRDIQIAAIVSAHGASIATRNVRHFAGLGVQVINPWEAT